jgi:hypothetical protein
LARWPVRRGSRSFDRRLHRSLRSDRHARARRLVHRRVLVHVRAECGRDHRRAGRAPGDRPLDGPRYVQAERQHAVRDDAAMYEARRHDGRPAKSAGAGWRAPRDRSTETASWPREMLQVERAATRSSASTARSGGGQDARLFVSRGAPSSFARRPPTDEATTSITATATADAHRANVRRARLRSARRTFRELIDLADELTRGDRLPEHPISDRRSRLHVAREDAGGRVTEHAKAR